MEKVVTASSADDWLRTYATLSRAGFVTRSIAACEEQWGSRYWGDPEGIQQILAQPDYPAYVHALRSALPFPLVVHRVCKNTSYQRWLRKRHSLLLSVTLSQPIAEAFWHLQQHRDVVLLQIQIRDPEAILMRGRPKGCELVVDSSRIKPDDVTPLKRSAKVAQDASLQHRLFLPAALVSLPLLG
jgi:hypothetical protein